MGPTSAKLNLTVLALPLASGLVVVTAAAVGYRTASLMAAVFGLISLSALLLAKVPSFRAGRWCTWGPGRSGSAESKLWWLSAAALAVAVLLTTGSLVRT